MDEMQEMLAHFQISKQIWKMCQGCDRLDEGLMASGYAEESWDEHGSQRMSGQDFAQVTMDNRRKLQDVVSHLLGQTLVNVVGDNAGSETYFLATLEAQEEDGSKSLHQMGGRYVDEWIREGGDWKIKKRVTLRDWSITHPVSTDFVATLGFMQGKIDGTDPSFRVLGVIPSEVG